VDDDGRSEDFVFSADLWRWRDGSWFFVTLPVDLATDLRMGAGPPRGFGSIRVEATLGPSVWRTSLFPDNDSDSFVLPVKKAVRVAAGVDEGDTCTMTLRLVDDA
jgi:hypothetical protein